MLTLTDYSSQSIPLHAVMGLSQMSIVFCKFVFVSCGLLQADAASEGLKLKHDLLKILTRIDDTRFLTGSSTNVKSRI